MTIRASLLVLTYNQEAYVRAAAEAALNQSYSPLEILFSDDGSSDRSFDILRQVAEAYDGPHKVILNRNPQNIGLIPHINKAVEMTTGEVLIPAYGDDISFPERAARLVEACETEDALLVHSSALAIDQDGHATTSAFRNADFFETTDAERVTTSLAHYLGASGAWHRKLFDKYGPLVGDGVYDDHILGFRAALEGRVSLLDEPLLYYRDGVGISHLKGGGASSEAYRARRRKILRQQIAVYDARIRDARIFGLDDASPIIRKLNMALFKAHVRLARHEEGDALSDYLRRKPLATAQAWLAEGLRTRKRR